MSRGLAGVATTCHPGRSDPADPFGAQLQRPITIVLFPAEPLESAIV